MTNNYMNDFLKYSQPYVPKDYNLANEFHRTPYMLDKMIFHRELEEEYEVGGQLASFGKTLNFISQT